MRASGRKHLTRNLLGPVVVFGVSSILAGALELGYAWRLRHDRGRVWRFVIAEAAEAAGAQGGFWEMHDTLR